MRQLPRAWACGWPWAVAVAAVALSLLRLLLRLPLHWGVTCERHVLCAWTQICASA